MFEWINNQSINQSNLMSWSTLVSQWQINLPAILTMYCSHCSHSACFIREINQFFNALIMVATELTGVWHQARVLQGRLPLDWTPAFTVSTHISRSVSSAAYLDLSMSPSNNCSAKCSGNHRQHEQCSHCSATLQQTALWDTHRRHQATLQTKTLIQYNTEVTMYLLCAMNWTQNECR